VPPTLQNNLINFTALHSNAFIMTPHSFARHYQETITKFTIEPHGGYEPKKAGETGHRLQDVEDFFLCEEGAIFVFFQRFRLDTTAATTKSPQSDVSVSTNKRRVPLVSIRRQRCK
jgi:hypothetical protein